MEIIKLRAEIPTVKLSTLFNPGTCEPWLIENLLFYLFQKLSSRRVICFLTMLLINSHALPAQKKISVQESNQNSVFRAGAAISKITPPVGCIMGNSYGLTISEGVHDDLYARVLVFDKEGVNAALIAVDLVSVPYEIAVKTRELIRQLTGIPVTNIILSATHAHAGPQMNPLFWKAVGGLPAQKSEEYVRNLPGMIAKSVQMAVTGLQPVRVSFGTVQENSVNFNRRFLMKDGSFKMNPGRMNSNIIRPAGPVDADVSVAYFESIESKPVAVLANFALHPAIIEGKNISADFPEVVSSLIAKVKGNEMVTVYTNGTSGNINHIDVSNGNQLGGFDESGRIGTIIAADVMKAFSNLHPVEIGSLQVRSQVVELPVPKIQPEEVEWAQQIMSRYGKPQPPRFEDVVRAWRILDLVELNGGDQVRYESSTTVPLIKGGGALRSEVQVIVLGDKLALVGFPGDAFVELGLAIKLNSPFPYTIVNEQSGNGTLSYVPNRKAFAEGGYEAESARFSPGGGEILVDTVIRILISLFPY
jgi:neutral ceramidase